MNADLIAVAFWIGLIGGVGALIYRVITLPRRVKRLSDTLQQRQADKAAGKPVTPVTYLGLAGIALFVAGYIVARTLDGLAGLALMGIGSAVILFGFNSLRAAKRDSASQGDLDQLRSSASPVQDGNRVPRQPMQTPPPAPPEPPATTIPTVSPPSQEPNWRFHSEQPEPAWSSTEFTPPAFTPPASVRTDWTTRRRNRGVLIAMATIVVVVAAAVAAFTFTRHDTAHARHDTTPPIDPTGARQQSVLPFVQGDPSGFYPHGIAVDDAGSIYVAAVNGGVYRYGGGATEATRVPFTNVDFGVSAAVDGAGDIFLADDGDGGHGRVQKITRQGDQSQLPFVDLGQDPSIAAAADGTVYVADGSNDRVLRMDPGAITATVLPLNGLSDPRFVAIGKTGDLVISDRSNHRILMVERGSGNARELPFGSGLNANGVAIDDDGNVYAAVTNGVEVLVAKTGQVVDIPAQGISPFDVAVDKSGTLYLTDFQEHEVVALTRTSAEGNETAPSSTAPSPSVAPQTAATVTPRTPSDVDDSGFIVFGGGARCFNTDHALMFMRTDKSALVVCQSEIDKPYYRGYRISDGATIDLYDVSRQPDGFVAVNAPDNARYVISSTGFQLIQNGNIVSNEPAVEVGP